MRKNGIKPILLYTFILTIVIIVIVSSKKNGNKIPTRGDSIEDVESLGGWWVSVPADENENLDGDVYSTFFNEDYSIVNLILPKNIDENKVVFYVRDAADRYAMRCEGDFSDGDLALGSKTIRLIKSELPFVFLSADRSELEEMDSDETKQLVPYIEGNIVCDNGIDSTVKISPRGNATWRYPKKPYALSFEKKYNLLGMSKNKKWNMIANFMDMSILSNETFYHLAEEIGLPYTCERRSATVYINCAYKGVYLFTTKPNVGKQRVDIGPNDYLLNLGDPQITRNPEECNYFMIDSAYIDPSAGLFTSMNLAEAKIEKPACYYFNVIHPKESPDMDFISAFVQRAFDALEDGTTEEYQDYFDVDNLVEFYLVEEFSHNGDAVARSIYLYYDSNSNKLMFGPIWDMDNTLKQSNEDVTDLIANRSWYRSFFIHDSFVDRLYDFYNNSGRNIVFESLEHLEESANSMQTDGELNLNVVRETYNIHSDKVVPDTYREVCDNMISDYAERIAFLDDKLTNRYLEQLVDVNIQ